MIDLEKIMPHWFFTPEAMEGVGAFNVLAGILNLRGRSGFSKAIGVGQIGIGLLDFAAGVAKSLSHQG